MFAANVSYLFHGKNMKHANCHLYIEFIAEKYSDNFFYSLLGCGTATVLN